MKMTQYLKWKADPSKGEVFTPISLVSEMLDKIPDEVWKNPDAKFLDPCMGKGTFLIEIVRRLTYIYGYTETDAKSRVYGYDIRVKYINHLNRRGFVNVRHKDFLNEEINMKFDAIVGNPPFQGKNKQDKLWVKFLLKSFDLCKDSGYVIMVNPNSWTKRPNSKSFGRITKLFMEKQLISIKLDVSNFFNGIGEKIGYQIVKNNEKKGLTSVELPNQEIKFIDYLGQKIVSEESEVLTFSVFDKIENSNHDRISKYFSKRDASDAKKSLKKGKFKASPFEEYNIPVLYTMNQTYYIRDNGFNLGTKFFFNFSGYYFDGQNPDKYMPILNGFVSGQATFSIDVPSIEQGLILRNNYSRKLIRFYNDKFKTGGFNTGIPNLPWLGYDKIFTDSELYEEFELTEDEINYIDSVYA